MQHKRKVGNAIPTPPDHGYDVLRSRKMTGKLLKDLRLHHMLYRTTAVEKLRRQHKVIISVSHLKDVENGRSAPRITTLLGLANLYGVTIEYLVGDAPNYFKVLSPMDRFANDGAKFR